MSQIITKLPFFVFREMGRYRQIVRVLVKYGSAGFLQRARIWEYTTIERGIFRAKPRHFVVLTPEERFRMAIGELGPIFIKMGQMLASRPDIVPRDLLKELEKLQDHVAFIPARQIRNVIEEELGKPVDQIFTSFNDKPVAAASLAQVHSAMLGDKKVAVKVQRPNIRGQIAADLEIMHGLAVILDKRIPELRPYNLVGLIEEFGENLERELNFELEATNMKTFAGSFRGYPWLRVPEVHDKLSTKRVLVMEFLDGIDISNVAQLDAAGYDRSEIANRGTYISLRSVFDHGFFHADPHSGNMLVLPEGVIGLIDFGMMGTLSRRNRDRLLHLLYFISQGDERRIARMLEELTGATGATGDSSLEEKVARVLQHIPDCRTAACLEDMLVNLVRQSISPQAPFSRHLLWITKSMVAVEGISRKLQVEIDVFQHIDPYIHRVVEPELSPRKLLQESYFWMSDLAEALQDLPYNLKVLMQGLGSGQAQIKLQPVGLDPLRSTMVRATNRISLSFILGSILLASSVLVLSGAPPHIGSIPILGFLGFIIAFILALIMIGSILQDRR